MCVFVSFREFELMVRNGSWVDAPDCQRIPRTHCDLTLDLGSDSDYNIHVRAHCGSELSSWSELSRTFNRRDSKTLTAAGFTLSHVKYIGQKHYYYRADMFYFSCSGPEKEMRMYLQYEQMKKCDSCVQRSWRCQRWWWQRWVTSFRCRLTDFLSLLSPMWPCGRKATSCRSEFPVIFFFVSVLLVSILLLYFFSSCYPYFPLFPFFHVFVVPPFYHYFLSYKWCFHTANLQSQICFCGELTGSATELHFSIKIVRMYCQFTLLASCKYIVLNVCLTFLRTT